MTKVFQTMAVSLGIVILLGFITISPSWKVMPGYTIKFNGKGASGSISGLKGTVEYDPADPKGDKIDITVDPATLQTGNSLKDKHAKGESWFDVVHYPLIKFSSSTFALIDNQLVMTGIIELHGAKKQIQVPVKVSGSVNEAVFSGTFKVSRKEFGIKGPFYALNVGDEFEVSFQVPVSK